MNIAILTQPLGHNYGGLLQAYALQRFLKDQGFEVTTIDRRTVPSLRSKLRARSKNIARFALGRISVLPTSKKSAFALHALAEFRDRQITMSPPLISDRALAKYCQRKQFDAFIVGSDQVWRPRYSPSIYAFFLDFLSNLPNNPSRLSYAASFGVDQWEFSPAQTARCSELMTRFDAVSIREKSGCVLSQKRLGRKAEHTPDPTLLLEADTYRDLIDQAYGSSPRTREGGAGLLAYLLDTSTQKADIIDQINRELGLESFSIKPEKTIAQVSHCDFHECVYPGIPAWLKGFRDADFVVTDSFHGTLFAIIFNKPFISIGNRLRGLSRFQSLLSLFGLEERLVETAAEVVPSLINAPINWKTVNRVREAQKEVGKTFLINNLRRS